MIDWLSEQSDVLMNPCYSMPEQEQFRQILDKSSAFLGHLWLATSGSTVSKWVGLSKQAILASAQAVNGHLKAHSSDRWIQTLPVFHVGGLGIEARAFLSGASVFNFREQISKWQPDQFVEFVNKHQGTLTSLVPAQLCDLIQLGYQSPASLRAVIIGGGALAPALYERAVSLGWKILPSYGLTECASQVATAETDSWQLGTFPPLKILPHIEAQEQDGRLCFKGSSLLSVYAYYKQGQWELEDPKQADWLVSEDRGRVEGSFLSIFGRADSLIKVGGESVDLNRLENLLQEICLTHQVHKDMTLIAYPDERLGHVIHLAVAEQLADDAQSIMQEFQQRVLPFERIRKIHTVPFLPKTALSKIRKQDLLKLISRLE